MINFKLKNRGESLVEVLVAVGILTIVLGTSFMLLNRGISTNISIKNKIIAINIAREGIEGVRNIRDTNWLKYSGDRRNKWLYDEASVDNVSFSNKMYSIDLEESYNRFILKINPISELLDLKDTSKDFSLYRLYKKNNSFKYTHDPFFDSSPNLATIFYRQIQLIPETPPECAGYPPGNNCTNSRLHVISRVQWREHLLAGDGNASQSDLIGTIVMETYLYDYLGRDEY